MNNYDKEDLDDFLAKVADVNSTISKLSTGEMSVEAFDEKYKKSELMEQMRAEEREAAKQKAKVMGREGKGEKENYIRFCRACFREFDIEIENCTVCGKPTMSQAERRAELMVKLEKFKEKKKLKLIKKARWENWQKTQAMFYKKTATNYQKWDFYESESDQDDKEPILPKDDPNFKAMEHDIKVRSNKRKADRKQATECKDRGNDAMRKGLYVAADKFYSDGLEVCKDLKELWTNRALARLKLERFEAAMDDCTRILEYCEVLEDGFEKSKALCFKAFLRRGMALRGQGRYLDAAGDFEKALELVPEDADATKWKQRCEKDHEMQLKAQKVLENKQKLTDVDFLDTLLETLQDHGPEQLCSRAIQEQDLKRIEAAVENEDTLLYFMKKKGLETLVASLTHSLAALSTLKAMMKNEKVQEGLQKCKAYERLIELLWGREMEPNEVLLCLEILEECSLNQLVRGQLAEKRKVKESFLRTLETLDFKTAPKVVAMLLSFASNLCYAGPKFKQMLRPDSSGLLKRIGEILKDQGQATDPDLMLVDLTLLSLLGNFSADVHFRGKIASNQAQILDFVFLRMVRLAKETPSKLASWSDYGERVLALLLNCLVGTGDLCLEYCVAHSVVPLLGKIFQNAPKESLVKARALSLAAKLCKNTKAVEEIAKSEIWAKGAYDGIVVDPSNLEESCVQGQKDPSIKLFAQCLRKGMAESMKKQGLKPMGFVRNMKTLLAQAHGNGRLERFVNICAALNAFLDEFQDYAEMLREVVPLVIEITKEKTDIIRKNAAILLAKLAKHPKLTEYVRELHGIEVLMSLGGQLLK